MNKKSSVFWDIEISQKIKLFITTAMRSSNPTKE
jgi:hypothetical protein